MKYINILDDFNKYELGSLEEVQPILDLLDTEQNNEIHLNLSGCIPDYPITSLIIDKIISQLITISGNKYLTITLDHLLPHETLVNWIFLGSKEFKISERKSLSYEEISTLIQTVCTDQNIEIKIQIADFTSKETVDEIEFK